MVVLLKKNTSPEQLRQFTEQMKEAGLDPQATVGENHTIIGLVGDTSQIDISNLQALEFV